MHRDGLVLQAPIIADEALGGHCPRRMHHVLGVGYRAEVVAKTFPSVDAQILVAAAYLHDVGYSPVSADSGFHPLDGARYIEQLDFPRRVVHLIARHSCAYREAELRGLAAELTVFPDEESPVRDALWWADMTTGPDGEVVTVDRRLEEIQSRYGPNDVVTVFVQSARAELMGAVERTEERLRAAGIDYEK